MESTIHQYEMAILVSDKTILNDIDELSTLKTLVNKIIEGKYVEVLSDTYFPFYSTIDRSDDYDPCREMMDVVEDYLMENDNEISCQLTVLLFGIVHLRLLLQNNWVGPTIELDDIFPNYADTLKDLEVDGEYFYIKVNNPDYLLVANKILIDLSEQLSGLQSRTLWSARTAMVHQQLMTDDTATLRKVADPNFQKALFMYTPEKNLKLSAMTELEYGLMFHHYGDSATAKEHFNNAQEITGLYLELSGALGKRTQYQTFETAQLVLLARSSLGMENITHDVPERVEHPDPEVSTLPETAFTDHIPDAESDIHPVDQCIILNFCLDIQNTNPRHGITREQMSVYVDRVLKNPNDWLIHSSALLVKSKIDFQKYKLADKAVLQIQVLVEQFDSNYDKEIGVEKRLPLLHQVNYPPYHKMKKELGTKFLKLGSAASARDIFIEMKMWDDLIKCYIVMDMYNHAEELLLSQLDSNPTPELWCIYGDLKNGNMEFYQKAWDLSGKRYSRAKRSMGKVCMDRGLYEEAIAHFKESQRINPQIFEGWYRMGVSAMKLNDFKLGADSFSRVVKLIPEDGEAWSNLATCYNLLDKQKLAHVSLKESLKYCQNNWKIWENFIVTSLQVQEYFDVLRGMNKMLDLDEKNIDKQALVMLIRVIIEDIRLGVTEPGVFLHRELTKYLQRIKYMVSGDSDLWFIYAEYYRVLDNLEESIDYRMKQCRTLQIAGWMNDSIVFQKIVSAFEPIVPDLLELGNNELIYSCKLFIQSVIGSGEKYFEHHIDVLEQARRISNLLPDVSPV